MALPADSLVHNFYRINADPASKILNDNITTTACPLDNGKRRDRTSHDLAGLEKLAVELQHIILVQSDLQTLTDFRRVNRRAMEAVDNLPEYQSIVQHSPDSLRAILSTELGKFITCQKLYDTLRTPSCECCRQPTDLIYLLTCQRVCFKCLCWRIKFCPITTEDAVRLYAVPSRLLAELPTMRSIPGYFGIRETAYTDRQLMVDAWSAWLVASEHWAEHIAIQRAQHRFDTDISTALLPSICYDPPMTVPFRWYPEPNRFMAVVRAPCIKNQE